MKKILFLFSLGLLFSLFLNCSCSPKENSRPPYNYNLYLRFEDSSNNDKVKGINYIDKEGELYTHKVEENAYKLSILTTDKSKENLFMGTLLYVEITDRYSCLIIQTGILPQYRPNQLIHKIVCPHIFGDNNEHTIVSNWKLVGAGEEICLGITVDGTYYQPENGTDAYGNPVEISLVILDN